MISRSIVFSLVCSVAHVCSGQDFLLTKQQAFSQQSESNPTFDGYSFRAEKRGFDITANVTLPSGSGYPATNIFLAQSSIWSFEEQYSTLSLLESEFAPGDYDTLINRDLIPYPDTLHTNLSFSSAPSFPSVVPQIIGGTWDNGVLLVGLGETIDWDPWLLDSEDARIRMTLDHGSGVAIMTTSDTTRTGFGLPASAMVGTTYEARLNFLLESDWLVSTQPPPFPRPSNPLTTVAATGNSVSFSVMVVPEPASFTLFGLGMLALLNPRRWRWTAFRSNLAFVPLVCSFSRVEIHPPQRKTFGQLPSQ